MNLFLFMNVILFIFLIQTHKGTKPTTTSPSQKKENKALKLDYDWENSLESLPDVLIYQMFSFSLSVCFSAFYSRCSLFILSSSSHLNFIFFHKIKKKPNED